MNDITVWALVIFVLFIILDAVLFGFAAASRTINESELARRAEEGDEKSAKIIEIIDKELKLNYTIQIFAMIMNVIAGAFVLKHIAAYFGHELYVRFVTAAVLIVIMAIFGITVPIRTATLKSEKTIYRLHKIVYFIMVIFTPVTAVITFISNCFIRLLGMNPYEDSDNVTEEEILTMVNEGHEQGVIEADEAEMISNIFEFGDKEAMDIMTHRKNILAVDGDLTLGEAVSFMLHENNSRYPVFDGDIDNIIGVIHIKDALKEHGNVAKSEVPIKDIEGLLYDVTIIPGTRNINDLFKFMQSEKVHMVIVVDEYGQTAGLVTMEDILEEIVGNILDEHDDDEEQITRRADNTYIVDGVTLLEDLEEELDVDFNIEDINTINGFITLKLGKIPQAEHIGFEFEYGGYRFKILEVEKKVVKTVSITKCEEKNSEEE